MSQQKDLMRHADIGHCGHLRGYLRRGDAPLGERRGGVAQAPMSSTRIRLIMTGFATQRAWCLRIVMAG
jgi:hypothetical protein